MMQFLIVLAAFVGMEAVAWFTHKYVMHGLGWFFHKDHIQSFLQDSRSDMLVFSIDERF